MSAHKFRIAAIAAWFVALVAVLVVRVSLGIAVSAAQIFTLALAGCVPAVVLLMVFRGAPRTIGQLLYDTEHATAQVARSDARDGR